MNMDISKTISSVLLQVPLGIILKNENSHEDMVAIMDHVHQYVPAQTSEIIHVDESGDSLSRKTNFTISSLVN